MTARAVLDDYRKQLAGITQGKWGVDRNYPFSQDLVGIFAKDAQKYVLQVENQDDVDDPTSSADAAFIASAPATVARLSAAVEALLAIAESPDIITHHPKGDKTFYVEAHRIRAAIENALREGQ